MNNSLPPALPAPLGRWLGRSVAWTVACVLPCLGLWYWVLVVQNAGCRSCGTTGLLTPLAVAMVLASRVFRVKAIGGLSPFYQQKQWSARHQAFALGWCLVLRLLLVGWVLLDAAVLLMMLLSWGDDGTNMWVN